MCSDGYILHQINEIVMINSNYKPEVCDHLQNLLHEFTFGKINQNMVIYDLICDAGHVFEAWFKSSADYRQQEAQGQLTCPVCESVHVRKLPSASYVSVAKNEEKSVPKDLVNHQKIVNALASYLIKNTDDVGNQFAEEARKIHYGEVEARNIRGYANEEEVKDLSDEGIDVVSFSGRVVEKKKLN